MTRCSKRTGSAWPVDHCKIEIDDGVAGRAGIGLHGTDQRHAVARDDLAERQVAGRETCQIDAQPFCQRGVDVGDAAFRIGGEKAGRRVVEMVDRLLQIEEKPLLFGPLSRNVGELPGEKGCRSPGILKVARLHPVPARAGIGAGPQRAGQTKLARRRAVRR